MGRSIFIAADSFKGSLKARRVASCIARGWHSARPRDRITYQPLSDGGENFAELLASHLPTTRHQTKVVQIDGVARPTPWFKTQTKGIALIDAASVIGLSRCAGIPVAKRDSSALAQVLVNISTKKPNQIILGLGGSGTNDGGFGLAKALGWKFLQANGQEIKNWIQLNKATALQPPSSESSLGNIVVAADVNNTLLGAKGATYTFGPQKGLTKAQLPKAEEALKNMAKLVEQHLGKRFKNLPHTGAAGGLGFALKAFLNAEVQSGFIFFAQQTNLYAQLKKVDLVICAEGNFDQTSLMGKASGEIAKHCQANRIPCLLLCATSDSRKNIESYFQKTKRLNDMVDKNESLKRPSYWLQKLAREVALEL